MRTAYSVLSSCVVVCLLSVLSRPAAAEDVSGLPAPPKAHKHLAPPRKGVIMLRQTDEGRLNVPVAGWGGLRMCLAKDDPETFRRYLKDIKAMGLNCVRPLFHPSIGANANDAAWAYFDWEACDRAVSMTQEEGLYCIIDFHNWRVNDGLHTHEAEWLTFWGWCLWCYSDWSDDYHDRWGQKLHWKADYRDITGKPLK